MILCAYITHIALNTGSLAAETIYYLQFLIAVDLIGCHDDIAVWFVDDQDGISRYNIAHCLKSYRHLLNSWKAL